MLHTFHCIILYCIRREAQRKVVSLLFIKEMITQHAILFVIIAKISAITYNDEPW